MTTEEKAKAYADKKIKSTYGISSKAFREAGCRLEYEDVVQAYEDGATEALSSQWVSVEDRLPERHEEVLTYRIGALNENAVAYHNGANWYTTDGEHIRPHYWLPIPPLKGGDE